MTGLAWVWVASAAALIGAVAAEVVLTARPGHGSFTARGALRWAGVYVSLAVAFGLGIGVAAGWVAAGQFYAGYLTEYSLSLDNLFIFYVIMGWFAVRPARQHRVLLLGIGLALVLRSALIVAGTAAVNRYGWLFYPLGGILLWTAIGLITSRPGHQPQEQPWLLSWLRRRVQPAGEEAGGYPIAWRGRRLVAGPMLLLALAIGVADVLFALDSIPAVFGITTSAYLIVACNAFALMGLRQVYVLLTRVLDRIVYLNSGLAIICAFIGIKLLLQAMRSSGARWAAVVPAWLSVIAVAAVLLLTVITSMLRTRRAARRVAEKPVVTTIPGNDTASVTRPLTAGERAVLERRFAVIDIDGNGVWQRDDYEQLTRQLCGTSAMPFIPRQDRPSLLGSAHCSTRCCGTWTPTATMRSPPMSSPPRRAAPSTTGPALTPLSAAPRTASSRWLTATATGCWTPGSMCCSPPCSGPAPSRLGGPSAGLTWTTMVSCTSRNSLSRSVSSSPAGTLPSPATSPSAASNLAGTADTAQQAAVNSADAAPGEIGDRDALLLHTPQSLAESLALDVRTGHEVLAVDPAGRTVAVREHATGRFYHEAYDTSPTRRRSGQPRTRSIWPAWSPATCSPAPGTC